MAKQWEQNGKVDDCARRAADKSWERKAMSINCRLSLDYTRPLKPRTFCSSGRRKIMLLLRCFSLVFALFSIFSCGFWSSATYAQQGTFVISESLNAPRVRHTATVLNNGMVLIVGGNDNIDLKTLVSNQLYNPATGAFSFTGSMKVGRYAHTATLLKNGLVLVVGGEDRVTFQTFSSAELYDPASGTFTSTGNTSTGRYEHTATLLNNGTVLIAGGWGWRTLSGDPIPSGPLPPGVVPAPVASAELYNPTAGSFALTGSLNIAQELQTGTLLNNGMVLMAGGVTSGPSELYNPATGTFSLTGSMNIGRYAHTATLLKDGKVLNAGGYTTDPRSPQTTAELYSLPMSRTVAPSSGHHGFRALSATSEQDNQSRSSERAVVSQAIRFQTASETSAAPSQCFPCVRNIRERPLYNGLTTKLDSACDTATDGTA
jgi:hypothetical protein